MLSTDLAGGRGRESKPMSDTHMPEQPESSEMSLGDALAFAVQRHRLGDMDNAELIYRKILEVLPEQPDALNFLGMITMHRGRIEEAVDLISRSIEIDSAHGERYNNLGNVLLAAERVPEATAAYEQAIAKSPASAAAYSNLGVIYRAQGRLDDAERAYCRALELDPTSVEAYNNSGNLFAARGCSKEAITHYAKALTLRPHDRNARQFTALAYAAIGDLDAAAGIYREWLAEEPDDPALKHLLAACSGVDVPPRAADDYIEKTFDKFSESFEAKLAHLQYRAPQLVAAAVENLAGTQEKRLAVLDAGCGTGLCGPLLAPYAASLVGVDLSSGMLDKARPRGVYDELVKAELTGFFQSCAGTYDLIVSADTLVYFGALEAVLAGAAQALRPAGTLIFTVEEAAESEAPEGHRINPHGRYSHTRSYVERTLSNAGFARVEVQNDVLRHEAGHPVKGLVVTAGKAGVNAAESDHAG
jgi:predicted TPR repeat methyltransferase